MGNINFICGIAKILELPKQQVFSNNVRQTQVRVQFPQIRDKLIVKLTFWGKLADDIKNYYKENDYILIEGSFSTQISNSKTQIFKKFNITVLRIYPFKLNNKHLIN